MSDYDMEMEGAWDSNPEDDEQDEQGPEVEIENNFYEAEAVIKTEKESAIERFGVVIMMEESHGFSKFSFSSLRYVVILSMELARHVNMIEKAKELLRYSQRPTVSKNQLSEAINDIQDAISKHLVEHPQQAREMYELILGNLKLTNESLWFSTSLRLGMIYLDERNFESLERIITELKDQCRDPTN
jgi:transcriptional regulator NrdR family protein